MEINDGKNRFTLWKSVSDPSTGTFSAGLDASNIPQFVVYNNSKPYWRSGPWNGQIFIGIPNMDSVYRTGFNLVDRKEGSTYLTFAYANESVIYLRLNPEGSLVEKYWYDGKEDWGVIWAAPEDECDVYGKCGPFGSCHWKGELICTCLKGFEPKNLEEWNRNNFTSGCVRKVPLQCQRNSSIGQEREGDGFLKLSTVKVPDLGQWSSADDNCGSACLSNCSCLAYSYYTGIGCMHWYSNLIDIQRFSGSGGVDLYIRVAYSELGKLYRNLVYDLIFF